MSDVAIIKRYNSSAVAYIDAGLLRDQGIECQINGENLINAMPMTSEQVTLSVLKEDEQAALELLAPSDN